MLLKTECVVMCPRDGCKLDVVRNCFRCRHYAHTSYSGNVAYVACCYPKTREVLAVEETEAKAPMTSV